jgi:Asp-tRNA(Asn)/Glu-tRNA(Gln) amidotransferase A subunit family amidase
MNLHHEWKTGRDGLSPALRARIEKGRAVPGFQYLRALRRIPAMVAGFTELFEQRYDAILTPAAYGTAPAGLASTGDPAFCALWTLCGMPALSIPLMQGANALPLGAQLVGPPHGDARLLRTARWLVAQLTAPA